MSIPKLKVTCHVYYSDIRTYLGYERYATIQTRLGAVVFLPNRRSRRLITRCSRMVVIDIVLGAPHIVLAHVDVTTEKSSGHSGPEVEVWVEEFIHEQGV